ARKGEPSATAPIVRQIPANDLLDLCNASQIAALVDRLCRTCVGELGDDFLRQGTPMECELLFSLNLLGMELPTYPARHAQLRTEEKLSAMLLPFRVLAPSATERASLQKHDGANARTVVGRKPLKVKNNTGRSVPRRDMVCVCSLIN